MMSTRNVRVALIQRAVSTDTVENTKATLDSIRSAADSGAQIICTQELFRSRYFCQTEDAAAFDLAEPIPGPTSTALEEVARDANVVIVASLFERRMAGIYHNTAAIFDGDRGLLGLYRKMHIPDDPEYYEKYYFTPGDLGFRVWDTRFGRVGVLICWDQWFPEGARITALMGADLLFYPTAIGWHDHERDELGAAQHDAWQTIQRSHAIANGVFVCAANRVGRENQITFWGQSFIADPFGRITQRASQDKEEILISDLDLSLVEETRRAWPFLRDRRIDVYGGISSRALTGEQ